MAGKPSKRRIGPFLLLPIMALLLCACSQHKVAIERRPSRPVKKGVYHVVERHQTLYRICKTYRVNMREVAALNGIPDHHKIQVGQRIFIPGAKKVTKVEIYLDDVVLESSGKEEERPARKKPDFIWPVTGKCVNAFEESERKRHQGIDISASSDTPIRAAASGVVIYSGNTIRGYGNMIILRHCEEYVTVYAHNQVNLVEEGARIEKGQVIGRVGQTGRATGPHLHFEIRRNNKPVDPLPYLR